MFAVPVSELLWLALAIMVGGVATGILAGLFGIGGGAVIVPVLYEVFRILDVPDAVRMQLCVGTSLAIIVPTTIRSYRAHSAQGAVLEDVVWAWPSGLDRRRHRLGGRSVRPQRRVQARLLVVATFVGAKFLFGRDTWRIAAELPGRAGMRGLRPAGRIEPSLMGVSGGSVSNVVQTLHGIPIHNAVATSAGLGVPITIAGTLGYMLAGLPHQALMPPLSIGYVSLIGVAVMAPVSSFTASYGARLAHAMPRRRLEIAFGLFLLAVAVRFIASLMW